MPLTKPNHSCGGGASAAKLTESHQLERDSGESVEQQLGEGEIEEQNQEERPVGTATVRSKQETNEQRRIKLILRVV